MSVALRVLFYVALVGSVTSSIYCGMVLAAAARFGLRKRRDEAQIADFTPAAVDGVTARLKPCP